MIWCQKKILEKFLFSGGAGIKFLGLFGLFVYFVILELLLDKYGIYDFYNVPCPLEIIHFPTVCG